MSLLSSSRQAIAGGVLSLIAIAACSTTVNNSSSSNSLCCTFNGRGYDCPSQAALEKCSDIQNHDPSECTARATTCSGQPSASSSSGATSSSGGSSSGATSSTSTSSSGGDGCSAFTCEGVSDCGGIAPCMASANGTTGHCYAQSASGKDCADGTTPTGAIVQGMNRTLCVPDGCPKPEKELD